MTQLELPIAQIDPRVQQEAARKLHKLVTKQRNSFKVQDYAKRRAAALRHTRGCA